MKNSSLPQAQKFALSLAVAVCLTFPAGGFAFDIYQGPLTIDKSVDPNILYLHDDSGSMRLSYMPVRATGTSDVDNEQSWNRNRARYYSSFFNKQYYNPRITYQPPLKHNGTELVSVGNADFNNAHANIYGFTNSGKKFNLSTNFQVSMGSVNTDDLGTPLVTDGRKGALNAYGGNEKCTSEADCKTAHARAFYYDYAVGYYSKKEGLSAGNTYEDWAFTAIPTGDNNLFGVKLSQDKNKERVQHRACPVVYADDTIAREKGNVNANCRWQYRDLGLNDQSLIEYYGPYDITYGTHTTLYGRGIHCGGGDCYTTAGAAVPAIPNHRPWCGRTGTSDYTLVDDGTCFVRKHVIGDVNGDGVVNASDPANGEIKNEVYDPTDGTYKSVKVTKFIDANGYPYEEAARHRTRAEEEQNFANWYAYYRTRGQAATSATSIAFAQLLDPKVMRGRTPRLAWDTIDIPSAGPSNPIRPFKDFGSSDTNYPDKKFVQDFYKWLWDTVKYANGTPLKTALTRAGEYYEENEAWQEFPGVKDGTKFSCRRSFTIMMTDGYYTSTTSGIGDADKTVGPLVTHADGVTTYTYDGKPPFFGENSGHPVSNSLADIAMYYWKRDLRDDIDNNLNPSRKDPAFWQHMQTFTIGLGVLGRLSDKEVNGFLENPDPTKPILWTFPTGLDTSVEKIDDLMHAGLNGHGGTAAAEDPGEFLTKLSALLNEIAGEAASNTALATSGDKLQEDSEMYKTTFDPQDWSGDLLAYKQCQRGEANCPEPGKSIEGALHKTPQWSAAEKLLDKQPSARNIYTWSESAGGMMPFNATNLDIMSAIDTTVGTPKGDSCPIDHADGAPCKLQGTDYTVGLLIDYLRGDDSYEDTSAATASYPNGFRKRGTGAARNILGDIMYSDPVSTGVFDYGYGEATATAIDETQRAAYKARLASFKNPDGTTNTSVRKEAVLVGANDGMLHVFNARTGEELFAFIPESLLGKLKLLANPEYVHQFYVDGATVVSDVLLNGYWKTVAVGSTGRGGRSFFALDVEKPEGFDPKILWEFSDPELGTPAHGKAGIALINGGAWSAVFGNGYNSDSDQARLFIVNIATGVATSINTSAGSDSQPNGLATPFLLDADEDGDADIAYAGDALGNLWKFDLAGGNAYKLLEARDAKGKIQPITAPPAVIASPENDGSFQVVIGTGKLFEQSDVSDTQTQTIYSVRDCGIQTGCTVGVATRVNGTLVQREFDGAHPKKDLFVNKKSDYSEEKVAFKIKINDTNEDGVDDGVDYASGKKGFYIDLTKPPIPVAGARVIYQPDMLKKNMLVQMIGPADDPCVSSVSGGLLEINPFTGAPVKSELFKTDYNSAGLWDEGGWGDFITHDGFVQGGGRTWEPLGGGRLPGGRQSWRQVR
jgi:type IV pilus assembly protein PilY1